jgi:hypothetical protein
MFRTEHATVSCTRHGKALINAEYIKTDTMEIMLLSKYCIAC